MHPGFYAWWKARHVHGEAHDACATACGPGHSTHRRAPRGFGGDESAHFGGFDGGEEPGPFGVKRPLRFLAYKLELSEEQVAGLAAILNDLKTERAQVSVDQRRRIAHIAEAIEGEAFDAGKAKEAGALQVEAAERLRKAVEGALGKIHALLDGDQRKRLAYLLRTGALHI